MIKIHILVPCEHCGGKAYLPHPRGNCTLEGTSIRYAPCNTCDGSGSQSKWVPLEELVPVLVSGICSHQNTSLQGGMHFSGGDVWDEIVEVCDDCGANLDDIALLNHEM